MIVSWKWLEQYVDLKMSHDELTDRLTMSGLNHEGTEKVDGDRAIDLEVTSNRADCLGHLGVAREIAVLFDLPLNIPDPNPAMGRGNIKDHCSVQIECPDLCYRYTARLLKGVKIGPSPDWLQDRLETLGIGIVNNVVDISNYVMFECGQPLHAFDFAKIKSGMIVVRRPFADESFVAIDHKTYHLQPNMCMIADETDAVAIGGVMGGADSEVSPATTDILVEAAYFDQLSVRNTARMLNLHSPSSFRFERNVDSAQIDWASRRCCQLILENGGGELLDGFIDVGARPVENEPIVLRLPQLKRVLGIDIPADFVPNTLEALGLKIECQDGSAVTAVPPSWRKDLTREVDLVEEVGRIYGFEKVPENANVPMAASFRLTTDRVLGSVRTVLIANGFDEAMTPSLVPESWSEPFSPWSQTEPLASSQPMLGVLEKASQNIGAVDLLRRSLVPSLLEARRINEYRSNTEIELFEIAKVYLTRNSKELPDQPTLIALVSGRDFFEVKGVVQTLVAYLNPNVSMEARACDLELLDVNRSAELLIADQTLGWIGEVSESGRKHFGLRHNASVAELSMSVLEKLCVLVPQHENQSLFPAISRDFNFVVSNSIHWADLRSAITEVGGDILESIEYRETFRDAQKDGPHKKRLLLSVTLRSSDATLTGEQADSVCQKIVEQCKAKFDASLVA